MSIETIKMRATDWRTWVRGVVGGAIGGGANAITNVLVRPDVFNLEAGWTDLWHSAAISALVGAALYLKNHPTPEDNETNPIRV